MAFSESRRKFLKLSLTGVAAAGALMFLRKATSLFDPISEEEYEKMLLGAVQNAFRLTDEGSLLNLEYYFINCAYKGNKVWAKYGPFENYMVVRLPQQHMAEQNFREND